MVMVWGAPRRRRSSRPRRAPTKPCETQPTPRVRQLASQLPMPELPEVEVVRRGLDDHVVGHSITRVDVLHPRPVRRHLSGVGDFADRLTGVHKITAARRRGKHISGSHSIQEMPWWRTWG
ncbi:MAG: DNA-formamidopyrimidine glycosylase family protein [Marmoricola sp.]